MICSRIQSPIRLDLESRLALESNPRFDWILNPIPDSRLALESNPRFHWILNPIPDSSVRKVSDKCQVRSARKVRGKCAESARKVRAATPSVAKCTKSVRQVRQNSNMWDTCRRRVLSIQPTSRELFAHVSCTLSQLILTQIPSKQSAGKVYEKCVFHRTPILK